jgi:hypothetical protein
VTRDTLHVCRCVYYPRKTTLSIENHIRRVFSSDACGEGQLAGQQSPPREQTMHLAGWQGMSAVQTQAWAAWSSRPTAGRNRREACVDRQEVLGLRQGKGEERADWRATISH